MRPNGGEATAAGTAEALIPGRTKSARLLPFWRYHSHLCQISF
jgi:hypothetical protein